VQRFGCAVLVVGEGVVTVNQAIDVAIVLCALYAGLSTFVSWVQERIASFLALRGWSLFSGILNLAGGDDALAAKIFNHPLVNATSARPNALVTAAPKSGWDQFLSVVWSRPPSYIDARNYSAAFWEVTTSAQIGTPPPALVNPTTGQITTLAQMLVDAPTAVVGALTTQISAFPNGKLRDQLLGVLSQAGNDYTKLLAATDGWFNAQMDRVSGWYKRQAQWITALLALIVVSISGVDTVGVVRTLSTTSPAQLEAMANAAAGRATAATGVGSGGFDLTTLVHLGNPFANWYAYWPGMLITLAALVLGGPFWFDALSSFANLRSAGRKPTRADQPPQ
jgi:hypothetical protein